MRKFYSKISSAALLLCLVSQNSFSMEEDRPEKRAAVAAAAAHPHASPQCLKFLNLEAMNQWISDTATFIKTNEDASVLIQHLQKELTLPLIVTSSPFIIPFMSIEDVERWRSEIEGTLQAKDLHEFPMRQDQFMERIRIEEGNSKGEGDHFPQILMAYHFLSQYCGCRYDLCQKIAELSSDDAVKIKYHQEAQNSLFYYFCHNFMPLITENISFKVLLRNDFISLSRKFVEICENLQRLTRVPIKIRYIKEKILNFTQQIELLDSMSSLNLPMFGLQEIRAYKKEMRDCKIDKMEGLVSEFICLYNYTKDVGYLNFAKTTLAMLPSDSSEVYFYSDEIHRLENPSDQRSSLHFLETYAEPENPRSLSGFAIEVVKVNNFLKEKNLDSAVTHIRKLERALHGVIEAQTVPTSQDAVRELSEVSLKRVYKEFYILMDQKESLYRTIVNYICSFLFTGDIQGAFDRFNAAADLEFKDGITLRTHQPYLRAILKNLSGNPEELFEISTRREVGELPKQGQVKVEKASKESTLDVRTPKKTRFPRLSSFPFLIKHENLLPYSFSQGKGYETRAERGQEEGVTALENKRISRVPLGLRQIVTLLVKKLEKKSDVAPYGEPESKKSIVSFTGAPQNPSVAPLPKVSVQLQKPVAVEKEEKRARHLKKKEERERNKRAAAAGPAEVDAEVPGTVKGQKSESEKLFENDTRTISDLYKLRKSASNVEEEIANNTWNFTRGQFVSYLTELGCTKRDNNGSHEIVELPDMVVYVKDGSLITILSKDLNIQGGSLTLQKSWDDKYNSVPFVLRPQILAAREKLRQLAIAIEQKKALDCEEK